MSTIVTRAGKGSPLTHNEVDANFNNLNSDKYQSGDSPSFVTVTASTKVATPVVEATSSAGGQLRNAIGTSQLAWGAGGGNNLSLEVATNINPANGNVSIAPTGTGTVTINPATAGTMNNVAIGGSTAAAGTFTTVNATTYASGSWNGSTIGVGYGGTGQTTYTNGQLLIGNTTGNTLTKATLTAGSGISITNGAGSITIATTGGSGVTAGQAIAFAMIFGGR